MANKPLVRIALGLGVASQAVGAACLGLLLYYVWRYMVELENPYRSELLIGAGIGYWFAMCAFACASALAFLTRRQLSKLMYRVLLLPGILLVALYVAVIAYQWGTDVAAT